MNFIHLKYAVEIEKTGSVSRAAEKLYMGQPNLSKAIKELEKETGITIFIRSSRGVVPTEKGKEFLKRARELVNGFDRLCEDYERERSGISDFSVAVARAEHTAMAFSCLAATRQDNNSVRLRYTEAGNKEIIEKLVSYDIGMGILRLGREKEKRYLKLLDEAGICYRTLCEYDMKLICSKDSALAGRRGNATASDLADLSELIYADMDNNERIFSGVGKTIAISDRGNGYELLMQLPDAYMWSAPVPESVLSRYGLIQLGADIQRRKCKDILIYRQDYKMSVLDEQFLSELERVREDILLDKKIKKGKENE